MKYNNEKLVMLRQQVYSRESIKSKLEVIYKRKQELANKLDELDKIRIKEQRDVENLEKFSLASILSSIKGDKVEKLEKERDEAYAATLKYETALKEFNSVCNNADYYENELAKISEAEEEYETAINEKFTYLKQSGNPQADEILRLDQLMGRMENELKEISEALDIGAKARKNAENIITELENAERSTERDIRLSYSRGDAKYIYLNRVQSELNELQTNLEKFHTELTDVRTIDTELKPEIDGFCEFADKFFDDFISGITALNKIRNSLSNAEKTRDKIISAVYRLEGKREQLYKDIQDTRKQVESLVIDTPL